MGRIACWVGHLNVVRDRSANPLGACTQGDMRAQYLASCQIAFSNCQGLLQMSHTRCLCTRPCSPISDYHLQVEKSENVHTCRARLIESQMDAISTGMYCL